jgi:uncharacterized secreted protein with C-terminal beta-propeller domain
LLSGDDISLLVRNASSELAPVCAVLGGIAGQQMLRALTHVAKPLNNVFIFDSRTQVVGKVELLQ